MLCTPADLSQWSSGGVCIDARAELVIQDVSDRIERYCGRKFALATTTERLQGSGSLFLLPPRWPIVSVVSVTVDGDAIDVAGLTIETFESDSARAIYREAGWPRPYDIAADLTNDALRSERRNIVLNYSAGFATIPAEVKLVAIHEALLRMGDVGATALLRERVPGGWDQQYDKSDSAGLLTARGRAILDGYKAVLYA